MKKLLSALYAMPGPVWLFGAFGVSRMWSWLLAWAASGSLPTTWTAAAFDLCTLLASLLPLTLLWLLLRRSPYAVQQVSLYAGLKSAAHFAALFLYRPVFGDLPGAFSVPASALLTNAVMCALWFGVLRYFERSEDIARLTSEGRLGTARNYTRTLNSFSAFLGGTDLPFAAFTEPLVEEYNAYLVRRGVVRNTVSFYMRILRAVYNRAVRQRLTEQSFPFSGVYTGIDHTRKRAVEERLIGRLRNLDLSGSDALALARDLFIVSYCTRGMSFVDMAFLRKRDLSGGEINYVRRKTGQLMTVHLETCMREIVRRYEWRTRNTPYVFPLLTAEEPGRAYSQYQIALNYYNRQLKRLSQLLGLEEGLSSYASRHSWATAARNRRVPITVINAGMGHTSERTTRIYLSSLESSVIDCANRKILSALTRI